jgi:hypothetical protein
MLAATSVFALRPAVTTAGMFMRSQSVLVLGCAPPTPHGQDQMRRLCVQAGRRGLCIVGADTRADLAIFDRSLADDVVAADVHGMGVVAELAHLRGKVDAVLTFRELSVEAAATVADAFGLSGISPSTAHTLGNKDLCRAALREAGFAQPEVLVTNEWEEAVAFLDKTSPGPWIVKPRDGMGSAQVHRVADADSLDDALTSRPPETPVRGADQGRTHHRRVVQHRDARDPRLLLRACR